MLAALSRLRAYGARFAGLDLAGMFATGYHRLSNYDDER
jgi:hypothetical protein